MLKNPVSIYDLMYRSWMGMNLWGMLQSPYRVIYKGKYDTSTTWTYLKSQIWSRCTLIKQNATTMKEIQRSLHRVNIIPQWGPCKWNINDECLMYVIQIWFRYQAVKKDSDWKKKKVMNGKLSRQFKVNSTNIKYI